VKGEVNNSYDLDMFVIVDENLQGSENVDCDSEHGGVMDREKGM